MATKEEVENMSKQAKEANGIEGVIGLLLTFMPAMEPQEAALAKVSTTLLGSFLTDLNRIANALETIAANTAPIVQAAKPDDDWIIYHASDRPEERSGMPEMNRRIDVVARNGVYANNILASNVLWSELSGATIDRWRYAK